MCDRTNVIKFPKHLKYMFSTSLSIAKNKKKTP